MQSFVKFLCQRQFCCSGDSRGVVTFWDGKLGAQLESYHSQNSDIRAICINEEEDALYCSGINQLICNYEKVKVGMHQGPYCCSRC